MRIISKTKAWDIILVQDGENAIYEFEKKIQLCNIESTQIKAIVNCSADYYSYIKFVCSEKLILAMSNHKNQIDVYRMKDLKKIRTIEWKYDKGCRRKFSLIRESFVYNVAYIDFGNNKNTSYITKMDLETFDEQIILEIKNKLVLGLNWIESEKDYLVSGIRFYNGERLIGQVGKYEAFMLENKSKNISFKESNKMFGGLGGVGVSQNQEILYWTCDFCSGVYNLSTSKKLIKNVEQVAFSENGQYIAYMKKERNRYKIFIYSIAKCQNTDELVIDSTGIIYKLEFRGNDEYIIARIGETMYLINILL